MITVTFHGKRVEIWMNQTQLRTVLAAIDSCHAAHIEAFCSIGSTTYADVPVLEKVLIEAIKEGRRKNRMRRKAIKKLK